MKKLMLTIIALTVATVANAGNYTMKIPLEQANGGTLPNGSIKFVAVAPATLVSTENVCEDSDIYDAANLYVTQTRNYTRTCKDVALYSDNSTVESNETVENLSVTGIKPHSPLFTNVLNFKGENAKIINNFKFEIDNGADILSPAHSVITNIKLIQTTVNGAKFQYVRFTISGDYSSYSNSFKEVILRTNSGVNLSCNGVSGNNLYYSAPNGFTEYTCNFAANSLTIPTNINISTIGSFEFILVD